MEHVQVYQKIPMHSKIRCILIHFPKRTFIHFFLPRRPRRLKRRDKSRPGKEKGRWWAFGKVGPIGCLHSSNKKEEERNKVRGWRSGKRVESIRLDDREKQNKIRIWPKKKQRYGYHDRSPSIKKNLSKSLRVSGAFKHPKYAGAVNDIAFLIENYDSFRKTKKNQMHFDPIVVLNHFVAPGMAKPSTMGGANAQGRSLDKRIRSRIAFFVESSTSEKKCLAEAKKRCSRGCKPDGTKLGFGRYGTQSCRVGRLSYRAIEAVRRAIIGHFHRAMSGQFRKNGKIWVRVFANIPITGKPTEVRMGRGKGNPTG
ncbi:hypothetical protein RYX36_032232 [Vicia faba]